MKYIANLLAFVYASIPMLACAVEQPKCGLPITFRNALIAGPGYAEKQKTNAVGTFIKKGGVLFYVAIADAQKFYTTEKLVPIKDASPLSPNYTLEPGRKYPVRATLALDNVHRDTFELIDISTGPFAKALLPVKPGGWVCSDLVGKGFDGQTASIGMPTADQDAPLMSEVEEISNGKVRSVSIVVKELDEATATLEISYMANGTAVSRSTMTVDLFAGKIALGTLSMDLQKMGNQIKVTAVREPADYADWMRRQGLR
ncbi:MAG: hypothetical protein EKK46_08995 [Rhodocyclaceae bacterium]|nr:MAG: hypothetical protein EKK46_08995 [Rhodocyclaceae bacterium]